MTIHFYLELNIMLQIKNVRTAVVFSDGKEEISCEQFFTYFANAMKMLINDFK